MTLCRSCASLWLVILPGAVIADPPSMAVEQTGGVPAPCFRASAWPEADQLFRGNQHWLGADSASSVDLGDGRILWLFADTWIHPSGAGTREGASMVSNSVAVQHGTDPSDASIDFYWGHAADGEPTAFISDRGTARHWFGNGVRVEDRLVLFLNRVVTTNVGLGFDSVGWLAVMVENPDAEPSEWTTRILDTPEHPLEIIVGFAAELTLGDYVYAFGSDDADKSHPIHVARWTREQVRRGDLLEPQWWAGDELGWVNNPSSVPIFGNGQSELSIHIDPATQKFIGVQTKGFGPADVMMRSAPKLTGPWIEPQRIYRPPEYDRPNVMIYAAKAHPELTGADLVLTYATNTFEFREYLTDNEIYYPRFVHLTRCDRQ